MKTLLKVLETITEKLLMASGYITSITIILMVVFLFREGAGLFNTPDIEEGYVLAVNRENPVQKLSPQQVMQVFDGDIASWGTLGWGGRRFDPPVPARRHHRLRDARRTGRETGKRSAMPKPHRCLAQEHHRLPAETTDRRGFRRTHTRRRQNHACEFSGRQTVVPHRTTRARNSAYCR